MRHVKFYSAYAVPMGFFVGACLGNVVYGVYFSDKLTRKTLDKAGKTVKHHIIKKWLLEHTGSISSEDYVYLGDITHDIPYCKEATTKCVRLADQRTIGDFEDAIRNAAGIKPATS